MAKKQYKVKKIILFFILLILNNSILAGEAYFDLSEKEIQIQTDFNGKDIIIFGILKNDENTVISIKGPYIDTKISKKDRIFGLWFNTKKIIYKKLPSIFFISSSSPIREILNKETLIKEKLYFDDLLTNSVTQRNFIPKKSLEEWDKNLIRMKKKENFYKEFKLKNIENKLFQTRVFFPAKSIPGNYEVTTYQIKNKIILSKKNRVIIIKKSGIGDKIYKFAHEKSSTYGILSIIFAILSGFIAATIFRRL